MNIIENTLKRVTVVEKKPLCFILNFDEKTDDKISAHFYDVSSLDLIRKIEASKHVTTIGAISQSVKYSDGKWELKFTDYVPRGFPNSVLLLQVSNLRTDGHIDIETGIEKYIPVELHQKWKHSQVKTGDIILAITGVTIGVASLIPEGFPDANLSQALGHIVLKKNFTIEDKLIEINSEYVLTYLNSKFGKTQVLRYGGFRAQHCGLSTGEVKSILIPLFDEKIQHKILEETKEHRTNAYCYEKRFFEKSEDITLLLERVLEAEAPRNTQQIFLCNPEKLGDRIDCLFNSPDVIKLQAYLSKLEEEGKIQLIKGEAILAKDRDISKKIYEAREVDVFKYIDIDNVDKEVGSIEGFTEDFLLKLPTRARQFIKENDILIPTPIGSTKGICIVPKEFEGQICSTGFMVVETQSFDEALLYFGILKSNIVQKQFYHFQSGSVQPSISSKAFENNVQIPVPKGIWRNKYAEKVKIAVNELLQLKTSYSTELQKSKEAFEKLIFENL